MSPDHGGNGPLDPEAQKLIRSGRLAEALPLAERAAAAARACSPAHGVLASLLQRLGRPHEAAAVVSAATALGGESAAAYDGLAYVCTALADHERAHALYRRALQLEPGIPRLWYNLACSERAFGRLDDAECAAQRALELDPGHFPSYLLRSELHVQTPARNHLADLEHRLADPDLSGDGRIFLGYALGKELDDLGRYDEAFARFSAASLLRRAQLHYDVGSDERMLARIAEAYAAPLAPAGVPVGDGARHGFIVGLPRSGTTLVERILSGLASVRSNGETENFARALAAAAPTGGVDAVARAAAAPPAEVAAHYQRLAPAGDAALLLEKLPTNYLYLGAIRRALPRSPIVWVRRDPLDSCFAMFRALFGGVYPFSYDFEELARYFAAHAALMGHWRAQLGATLYELSYETLVREPHDEGRALAAHCGLSWETSALDIRSNRAASLTASAAQVRRPIYGTSSGRWRHYRAHLAPLVEALRRHGVTLPDDA